MQLRIKTEPSIEPVTVTELKEHLRIDSGTFADNISASPSIGAASYSTGTSTGGGVDVLGYNIVANLTAGAVAAGATLAAHLEESDDDSTYTDVSGSTFTEVSTGNQNTVVEKAYTGSKQYVRASGTVSGGSVVYGIDIIKYAPYSSEDTYLEGLITVARQMVEEYLKRALVEQTWYYHLSNWPNNNDFIYIPLGTLSSVASVTYYDSDGSSNAFSAYITDIYSNLGRVVLDYGETWPTDSLYPSNPITIEYKCGYGDEKTDVPKAIRMAIMMIAGELYRNRENSSEIKNYAIPIAAERLLYPYRLWLPSQDGDL